MADRIALAIEPDKDTANQIRRLLEPKGFQVESIPNGDEAMEWGRTNKPAVIILSVEPRKVGYAISNKLRRSPSLREVPLVLISSEETLATFEQHKKLKSRADEYLLKPLEESVFVSKVAGLVESGTARRRFTSSTPIRTSCWRRTTKTSSSTAKTRSGRS
jgi:DNA-binding response OmpR family regulator